MRVRPDTTALLSPFSVAKLDAKLAPLCALGDDDRIVYTNPAWDACARANGAQWASEQWGVGASYLDAIQGDERAFYAALFARARADRAPLTHEYDCSTPERERRYQLRLTRCASGVLLAVHSLVFDAPPGPGRAALEERYRGHGGTIVVCVHCRRTRRADSEGPAAEWEWAPAYVEHPPFMTTRVLCYTCLEAHFSV